MSSCGGIVVAPRIVEIACGDSSSAKTLADESGPEGSRFAIFEMIEIPTDVGRNDATTVPMPEVAEVGSVERKVGEA
jgi:hypothetical protein